MTCLIDNFHRRISYLRISVTDHCDLRCIYCTAHQVPRLTHDDILRYEEIERIARIAAGMGIENIRLTGGEPLMRPHVVTLVEMLKSIEGIKDISMTTNATQLARYAVDLKAAGLDRVNISLDSLKEERFTYMTGRGKLAYVLEGIEAARQAGLEPVKINTVVLSGINDDEILDFATRTVTDAWHVRFIEYMPFACDGTQSTVFSANQTVSDVQIRDIITRQFGELEPVMPGRGSGPAKYYRLKEANGTIGFIDAVSGCFCQLCNRMRLTADGRLRPCLLEDDEIDIKTPIRNGVSDAELVSIMLAAVAMKRQKHRLGEQVLPASRQMWQIGG